MNTEKVQNRQARFNYEISERLKAGIVLEGWEVKAALRGHAVFQGSSAFVRFSNGEAWLEGVSISVPLECADGLLRQRDPVRSRKLLLNRSELSMLEKKVSQKGMTVVPLELVKERKFKVILGVAKGKNKADKRQSIKTRDMEREIRAVIKHTR